MAFQTHHDSNNDSQDIFEGATPFPDPVIARKRRLSHNDGPPPLKSRSSVEIENREANTASESSSNILQQIETVKSMDSLVVEPGGPSEHLVALEKIKSPSLQLSQALNSITHSNCAELDLLRFQLNSAQEKELDPCTWGARQRRRGLEIANSMSEPMTSCDCFASEAEAFTPTAQAYSQALASGQSFGAPVFLNGQGQYNWGIQRPIDHILASFPETCTIDIQDPSLAGRQSYRKVAMSTLKKRLQGNKATNSPCNVLDLASQIGPILIPPVIQCWECSLLNAIEQNMLQPGNAKRAIVNTGLKKSRPWKQVTHWLLLAEGGAISEPHHDHDGYSSWLTVVEGKIFFAWLCRPTEEDFRSYKEGDNGNGAYRSSPRWRYRILNQGQTVFFESGLVHAVLRLSGDGCQTMMVGGHYLRRSQIREWFRVFLDQIRNPEGSNEDLDLISKSLINAGAKLVGQLGDDGGFGDEAKRMEIMQLKTLIDREWSLHFKKTGERKK
ncbi:MAG: hypothetical protein M1820_005712 [Bogoriella megaspora]|nr:MAG: hypothetical protein M1820_005712 [Bogoriella megaspora]